MKKLFALLALTFSPVLALQVTATDTLNLRSGPTATSSIVGKIPKGTRIEIGMCNMYCPVIYQGKRGYVARQYLKTLVTRVPVPSVPVNAPGTYTNVDGQQIQRPTFSDTRPAGAFAKCNDGSYSFSTHRRGTCSHHGGVDTWY